MHSVHMLMRLLCVVIFSLFAFGEAYANTEWNSYVLVAAKPLSVDIKENLSSNSDVYAGEMYKVKLKVLEVLHGDLDKKNITLNLFASHKEVIKSEKKIYILIKKEEGSLSAISWATDRKIVCFPIGAVNNKDVSENFKIVDEYTKSSCIAI